MLLLTDSLLLDYKRCSRRSFLNVYGDGDRQDPERDFVRKLRAESQRHVRSALAPQSYCEVRSPDDDWHCRATETEKLMQQGRDRIFRGVLALAGEAIASEWEGIEFAAAPTLLVKHEGTSKFGDWYYEPVNIKLGKRPKAEYKIVAAFQAQLLAVIQGRDLDSCRLILREQDSYTVNLSIWDERTTEALCDCLEMLQLQAEPEVFISRQKCSLCRWYSHCYEAASRSRHLSLLPGVTPPRYEILQVLGLTSVEAIARAALSDLGEAIGWETAAQLQQQARAAIDQRARLRSADLVPTLLPSAEVELYFDIEAEPDRRLDYLLGVLAVNQRTGAERFYAFLAESPEQEPLIWQQFLSLTAFYSNAPIFHFAEYEVEAVKRLGALYKTPRYQIEELLERFVDLRHYVTETATLPIESYSLKSIAQWMGFRWRDEGVGGDLAVWWYDRWLAVGDRRLLESILRYNEDDCRATRHLKDWLASFIAQELARDRYPKTG